MGRGSARAQGLQGPITDPHKLAARPDQRLYLAARGVHDGEQGAWTHVLGLIKFGRKRLFIYGDTGAMHEIEPVCVLDFFVHPSVQGGGIGRMLYDHGLADHPSERPHTLGYDRPSPKFLAFLAKHFGLRKYVPQVNNVFREMTVHENLEMGAFLRSGDLTAAYDRVYGLFPDLKERRKALAGNLSGGQRQMVAMGRALMLEPKLLLLDEPTAGLSPKYMEQIFQICRDVRDTGVTILLVEQHAKQALAFADRGYVLASGANRHEGTGAALLADRDVAAMFLGG